jgi:hypothetical protein
MRSCADRYRIGLPFDLLNKIRQSSSFISTRKQEPITKALMLDVPEPENNVSEETL